MREHIWRSLLSVRTFFGASSRGLAQKSFSAAAVPRLKRQTVVTASRTRGALVSGIGVGRRGRGTDTQETVSVRRSLPVRGKQEVLRISRPLRVHAKPLSPAEARPGMRAPIREGIRALKRSVRLDGKPPRAVKAPKRLVPGIGREALLPRRVGAMAHAQPLGRVKHVVAGVHSAVHRTAVTDGGPVGVPPVRKHSVDVQSSERAGQSHDVLPVFPPSPNHHDGKIVSGDPEQKSRSDDLLSGNRRSRLAARRSGGGVDEIMQPQYPGRSIGFF